MGYRKGKDYYSKKIEQAKSLHSDGMPIKDIASKLGVSYSAAYHWIKELRSPKSAGIDMFILNLREKGPLPAAKMAAQFPKHNYLFLIASRRGYGVKRKVLNRKYRGFATWYFLDGQEAELDSRIQNLVSTVSKVRAKLRESI